MTGTAHERGRRLGPPEELSHGDFEMVVRRLADDLAFGTDTSLFTGSGHRIRPVASLRTGRPHQADRLADDGADHAHLRQGIRSAQADVGESGGGHVGVHGGRRRFRLTKHDLAVWMAAAIGVLAQRRLSPCAVIGAGERRTRVEPSLLRSDLYQALEPLRAGRVDEATRLGERLRELVVRSRRASM